MSDDIKPSEKGSLSASLARIADALGLPTSYFYAAADGEVCVDKGAELGDAAVLTLVRSYLQTAHPEARQEFVEAVKAIAADPSS